MIGNLADLKDIHKGKRCFIIGSGFSLLKQKLLPLKDEFTFITTLFPLHPLFKDIKPNYYCMMDIYWIGERDKWPLLMQTDYDALKDEIDILNFFPDTSENTYEPILPNHMNYYLKRGDRGNNRGNAMSLDLVAGINSHGTVILDYCLPIAFYMGFTKIYLLGCDCDYGLDKAEDFSKAYFCEYTPLVILPDDKLKWQNQWYERVIAGYEVARKLFEEKGRKIYNATAGGKLEVFERVKLEDII